MFNRIRGTALSASLLAGVLMALGCSAKNEAMRESPHGGASRATAAPDVDIVDPHAAYYAGVDASTSEALRHSLHELIDDHRRATYSQCWNVLKEADQDPANAANVLDLYGNHSYAKVAGGNGPYNREHSWPKSYGFPNDNQFNYPYTDCHHLFLCNGSYNSSRGNKPYDYCNSTCRELPTAGGSESDADGGYPGSSNWTRGQSSSGVFEVWMGRRGDVARAMFYMDVRYEGGTHGGSSANEPDLVLTDDMTQVRTGTQSVAHMGRLATLLEWHHQDPVDDKERLRNDAVERFQGNRNPFIDHPEWADCVFSGDCD